MVHMSLEERAASLLETAFEQLYNRIEDPVVDEEHIIDSHFNDCRKQLLGLKTLLEGRNNLVLTGKDTAFYDAKILQTEYWLEKTLYALNADVLLAESEHFENLKQIFSLLRTPKALQ